MGAGASQWKKKIIEKRGSKGKQSSKMLWIREGQIELRNLDSRFSFVPLLFSIALAIKEK